MTTKPSGNWIEQRKPAVDALDFGVFVTFPTQAWRNGAIFPRQLNASN
jgi:hypothetical protein